MSGKSVILFSLTFLIMISCDKNSEEITLDIQTASLVQTLDQELYPLTVNPLIWSDNDLHFLDRIADNSIIALGEATHGTAEFFNSKHRIFKYLVENHNFKIFAFEADFGESLLINDAIQRGATDEIEELMKTKMHFWTWKTEEVKSLLQWMSEYNIGKSEESKIHYMGVDCQFNTFHPGMVKEFLLSTGAPFISSAEQILDEAETASQANFDSYTSETFGNYLEQLDALQDSINTHSIDLINASSEKEYKLNARIVKVIRQVSEVRFSIMMEDYSINYRDQYMAENATWLNEYFNEKKMVLWAHNGHISNDPNYGGGGAMGHHLKQDFGNKYSSIAFLFSQGSFTAVGQDGNQYTDLGEQVIDVAPKKNSFNYLLHQGAEVAFSVEIERLQQYEIWNDAFVGGMEYFDIGSVYNNNPENYYRVFSPTFYDYIIYFDKSTASILL